MLPRAPVVDLWGFAVPPELQERWLKIEEAAAHPDIPWPGLATTRLNQIERKNPKLILRECQKDIFSLCYWCRITPTYQQAQLMYAVQRGYHQISAKSGNGIGKTCSSVIISLFWGLRYKHSLTLLSGPKMEQLRNGFLSESAKIVRGAHPAIRRIVRVTKSQIFFGAKQDEQLWRVLPVTATEVMKLQGKHNDRMNLIVDEASGVADPLYEALEGTLSNTKSAFTPNARRGQMVLLGNPNVSAGYFHRTHHGQQGDWKCLTFNAELAPTVNKARLKEFETIYGRESNFYRIRVLGQFPLADAEAIIALEHLNRLKRPPLTFDKDQELIFSIDFARRGGDECVCFVRNGNRIIESKVFPRTIDFEPIHACRWAARREKELKPRNPATYIIDSVGMGQGMAQPLEDAGKIVIEFGSNQRASSSNAAKFANAASEAWWHLGSLIRRKLIWVPTEDHVLVGQLTSRRWGELDPQGRFMVEPKKVYRTRTGLESPDRADALVMAFSPLTASHGEVVRPD